MCVRVCVEGGGEGEVEEGEGGGGGGFLVIGCVVRSVGVRMCIQFPYVIRCVCHMLTIVRV